MKNSDHQKKAQLDAKADKNRIKKLERELARKDKVLAEAAVQFLESTTRATARNQR